MVLCCVVLCRAVLCCVVLCCVMLCRVVLCFLTSFLLQQHTVDGTKKSWATSGTGKERIEAKKAKGVLQEQRIRLLLGAPGFGASVCSFMLIFIEEFVSHGFQRKYSIEEKKGEGKMQKL